MTVQRFNAMATAGIDDDFKRGEMLYDQYLAIPIANQTQTSGPSPKLPFTPFMSGPVISERKVVW